MSCWQIRDTAAQSKNVMLKFYIGLGLHDPDPVERVVKLAQSRGLTEDVHKWFVEAMVEGKHAVDERDAEREWRWFMRVMSPGRFALRDNLVCWANRVRIDLPVGVLKSWRLCQSWMKRNGGRAWKAIVSIAVIVSAVIGVVDSCRR